MAWRPRANMIVLARHLRGSRQVFARALDHLIVQSGFSKGCGAIPTQAGIPKYMNSELTQSSGKIG